MAIPGALTEYNFDVNGTTWSVWSKPNALDPFVDGLTPVTEQGATNVQQVVKGHSRRQYPGDTSKVAVPQHTRTVLRAPRSKRSTLPGENVYFEILDIETSKVVDVVQATTNAPFVDFHSFCTGGAVSPFQLRSAYGTPYYITENAGR